MLVSKQEAIRLAREVFKQYTFPRIVKCESYFSTYEDNVDDFVDDICFPKSNVLYVGTVTFNGTFEYFRNLGDFLAPRKTIIHSGKFELSDPSFGSTCANSAASGAMVVNSVPLILSCIDGYHGYQFQGWKITVELDDSTLPVVITNSGHSLPVDAALIDTSYGVSTYPALIAVGRSAFRVKPGASGWEIFFYVPKNPFSATFAANYTVVGAGGVTITGTVANPTADGHWAVYLDGHGEAGTITLQDIS